MRRAKASTRTSSWPLARRGFRPACRKAWRKIAHERAPSLYTPSEPPANRHTGERPSQTVQTTAYPRGTRFSLADTKGSGRSER
jgi:hypothetical protein